mgnify:CR=1 FL=1
MNMVILRHLYVRIYVRKYQYFSYIISIRDGQYYCFSYKFVQGNIEYDQKNM